MKKREAADFLINILLGGTVLSAWLSMAFSGGASQFSSRGLGSLKYFTVLSNLFFGAAAFWTAWEQFGVLRGRQRTVSGRAHTVKLAASTAVGLTFAVVMAFLGPVFGFSHMFTGSNFWFHLIVPLAAMVQFVLLEADRVMPLSSVGWSVIPMLAYGTGYFANVLIQGRGEYPNLHDFYGFAMWGNGWACAVFAVIAAVTFGIAAGLRAGNQAVFRRRE